MKIIGIGIDEGCDGSCGIITIKKKGKVAMLEKEVHENAEKLNLEGKRNSNLDLLHVFIKPTYFKKQRSSLSFLLN